MTQTLETKPARPVYPPAEFAKLYAPNEKVPPALKLRDLLRAKFSLRRTDPDKAYLLTAGAYDALTASLLTAIGFEAIYASGWQLAVTRHMYPDIGIYPSHAMVDLVRELLRGVEGTRHRHFHETGGEVLNAPPVFADMEAGFGGPAQAFTLARELIRAGAAGIHLEDQDPSERCCRQVVVRQDPARPKALVPTRAWIEKLVAVKAAAQASETELVIIARTDAMNGTAPGGAGGGLSHAVDRALEAAALGVDVVWPEFGTTTLDDAQRFAEAVHRHHPNQILGYNLSPSLQWGQAKREGRLPSNRQLAAMGYALQFSTLLAFRAAGMALETWLKGFRRRGVDALADLQLVETASLDEEPRTRLHREFAGTDRWLDLEQLSKAVDGRAP